MNGAYLCANCGCTEAIQETVQHETVTADENGPRCSQESGDDVPVVDPSDYVD